MSEEIESAETEVVNGEEQPAEQPSAEDRARKYGWKPEDEYKGKNEWVDAEQFIESIETDAMQARKANRTLERRFEKQEKTLESIVAHQQRQVEAAEKQGYDRARQEYDKIIAKGVEDGDTEVVKEAIEKRDKLIKKEIPETDPNKDYVKEWKQRNTWFDTDFELNKTAMDYSDFLAKQGKSVQEQLEQTEEYIKNKFPDKFPEMRRNNREAPNMGGNSGNNVRKGKPEPGTYEALTRDARSQCDRFVNEMVTSYGKDKKEAKAEWLRFASVDMFEE